MAIDAMINEQQQRVYIAHPKCRPCYVEHVNGKLVLQEIIPRAAAQREIQPFHEIPGPMVEQRSEVEGWDRIQWVRPHESMSEL